MRWSLVVPTFLIVEFALSFVSVALPAPRLSLELEGRALRAKTHSKAYRANAAAHHNSYVFGQADVAVKELPRHKRLAQGQKLLRVPKLDADHIYEHQMLKKNFKDNGLDWNLLSPGLREKVTTIFNRPGGVALIPATINQKKGSFTKKAMLGKPIVPHAVRDKYVYLSYPTARKTAKLLDKALKNDGHKLEISFRKHLRKAMDSAGILKPGQRSPPGSARPSSPGASSRSSSSSASGQRRSPRLKAIAPSSKLTLHHISVNIPRRQRPISAAAQAKAALLGKPPRRSPRIAAKHK